MSLFPLQQTVHEWDRVPADLTDEQAAAVAEVVYAEAVREGWPGSERPLFSVIPGGRYQMQAQIPRIPGFPRSPGEIAAQVLLSAAARKMYPDLSDRFADNPDLRTWFGSLMASQ